ncbi:glycoside hydrolase family 3 [Oceanimonas sp. GK1]|uniref:beta-N-acetylhexosaminidase n=1 Tax=Oceanimonas sp. (strain GK1 / IBRC-M 10197) TaxID=511062 RepID=UPI000249558F|nr:beta-N-acetylhexosaminidase [Oceanimonas sp. GK1]AEY01583.1 glycoside hydrolase family 3 [Oceanimonas sp. GK1]
MGPFILDVNGCELEAEERELLEHPAVGGVIFFARNYHDRAQLTALVRAIRAVKPGLLLTVDHEGGRVQRFRDGFFPLPAPGKLAGLDHPERQALLADAGWLMAAELLAHDIDLSFAPVLDLERGSEVIGDRSFGADPAPVIDNAGAYIGGMKAAGMAAVAKHFPGHGSVRADSHTESPVDERELAEIEQADLVPFQTLIAQGVIQGVMPAHVIYNTVDERPAGFSEFWLKEVLRRRLGFHGLIFSDDLTMEGAAVAGGYAERARQALAAGCDLLLACNHRPGAVAIIDSLPHDLQRDLSSLRKQDNAGPAHLYGSQRWRDAAGRLRRIGAELGWND